MKINPNTTTKKNIYKTYKTITIAHSFYWGDEVGEGRYGYWVVAGCRDCREADGEGGFKRKRPRVAPPAGAVELPPAGAVELPPDVED